MLDTLPHRSGKAAPPRCLPLSLLHGLALLICCGMAAPLQAETGYAVDDCRILMRRGPETRYKIVQMLKIGEEMEILEDDRASGWARVRATASGLDGWVLRRLISPEMPPQVQLDTIRETLRRAEEERNRLRSENEELRKRVGSQEKLEAELTRIRKISQNALEIERENESLAQKLRTAEQEMKQLSDDNRILERQTDTSFFLAGSAVLAIGMISGAVLARRRRSTFGSLE
ncbi:TIGR04211 family SH3 domain-containing protein [Candidatus Magnetaquicoccus inordinatus]|uniref:TIGR04211 family SH3 domain-containing protein n=1 Tax=Candidatus Magnetaquicoccus inordinatus TaxID=2496818 RepID=UPI00187D61F1|nr:TIGR04211 family SH3 domain-containing protein [Candidatus Magnetaquicoccus inordinatus]